MPQPLPQQGLIKENYLLDSQTPKMKRKTACIAIYPVKLEFITHTTPKKIPLKFFHSICPTHHDSCPHRFLLLILLPFWIFYFILILWSYSALLNASIVTATKYYLKKNLQAREREYLNKWTAPWISHITGPKIHMAARKTVITYSQISQRCFNTKRWWEHLKPKKKKSISTIY